MNTKILFLANIQYGEKPTGGGVQTRNQHMLNWFQKHFDTKFFDTRGKSSVTSLLVSLLFSIFNKNRLIVVSYGLRGAKTLVRILSSFRINREIIFFVPGGDIMQLVSSKDIPLLSYFKQIYVQGIYLNESLNSMGYTNVSYCPNFRSIDYFPEHKVGNHMVKFVYVGRLIKEKGVDVMLKAFSSLVNKNCSLTIYGKETEYYNKDFFSSLRNKNIYYKGYLDLKKNEGYDELATYDILLFPTFYEGEGFPGTLVDALICGLPVITTDFHSNAEVIQDRRLGLIVPIKDCCALESAMNKFLNGELDLPKMSKDCQAEAKKYNIDKVLTPIFKDI